MVFLFGVFKAFAILTIRLFWLPLLIIAIIFILTFLGK